ncbi:MAG: hypothetical protein R3F54_27050 [Alphaproteobacteria bacterium]
MTYLATEMVLYLLSAALIGLALGGLIWGGGKRRQLKALRADLMARLESQKAAHEKTRLALDSAETRTKEAVRAASADAARSLAELEGALDAERLKAEEAESALEQMRADVERARNEGNASQREALDNALRAVEVERSAAAQAQAREAQSRAQIEELRLLIGAEKLAAENARAELDALRAEMRQTIDSERAAHEQATTALHEIRSALARSFGPEALGVAAAAAAGAVIAGPDQEEDAGVSAGQPASLPLFPLMTDRAADSEALHDPDDDEADSEDREDPSFDLATSIDAGLEPESDLDMHDVFEVVEPDAPQADEPEAEPAPEPVTAPAERRIGLVSSTADEAAPEEPGGDEDGGEPCAPVFVDHASRGNAAG